MSFEKILFKYIPPETIQALEEFVTDPASSESLLNTARAAAAAAAAGDPSLLSAPAPNSSRAQALINQLKDLSDTALYLEDLLVSRNPQLGMAIDPAIHAEMNQSFIRLFNVNTPPPSMTVQMYNNLLETEAGITRTDIILANNPATGLEVSPVQRADLLRVLGTFESTLADSNQFDDHLPLLLRELKGDRITFDHMQTELAKYPSITGNAGFSAGGATPSPVASVTTTDLRTQTSNVVTIAPSAAYIPSSAMILQNQVDARMNDVNQEIATELGKRLDLTQSYYAATYNLATQVDKVYLELDQFVNQFLLRPIEELVAVVSAVSALVMLFHKKNLKDMVKAAIGAFVMPRLMAEVSSLLFMVDRLVNKIVAPALNLLRSVTRLTKEIAGIGQEINWMLDGGLTGRIRQAATGHPVNARTGQPHKPDPSVVKALNKVPQTLGKVLAKINWALNYIQKKEAFIKQKLFTLMDRNLGKRGDRLEILSAMSEINAIVNIVNSLILQSKSGNTSSSTGASTAAAQPPPSSASTYGTLVSNLQQKGVQVNIQDGRIVPVPQKLPVPATNVARVLSAGGASRLNPAEYFAPK